jgi:non-ribosomal peptide synthetase component F
VRAWTLDAQAHKECPSILLAERLRARGGAGREPYRAFFVMEPSLPAQASGWSVHQMEVQTGTAKFDLTLEVEARAGIIGRFEYASDLFDAATIRRLIGHLRTVLEAVAADAAQRLSALPLLTAEERWQLVTWNRTEHDYPRDECIHRLFAAHAARAPEAVALECGERRLNYGELDRRANRLAHRLRGLGVGPDVPVGVYGERGLETATALLAVLKAGGAYVPLDPAQPMARLAFMLTDTGARAARPARAARAAFRWPRAGAGCGGAGSVQH